MSLSKRIVASSAFQEFVGTAGAWYLKFVWMTSRIVVEPPEGYAIMRPPAVLTFWHGQHFLAPLLQRYGAPDMKTKVLISRHRDGEVNARAAHRFGIGTIRGSGAHNREFQRKGGATAFTQMLDALKDGINVALTADVPKISRVAGMGVVKLAQLSGRPIYAVAIASSRRIVLKNWDKTAINLPFSRIAICGCEIVVPPDADGATLKAMRQHIEDELNRLTKRAYELADGKGSVAP